MSPQLQNLLWMLAVLAVVYLPIQIYAVMRTGGLRRALAGLPLLVMVPLVVVNCLPANHGDGSLAALPLIFATPVAVLYLAAVARTGPVASDTCPHCGHVRRVRSFRLAAAAGQCPNCGQ